MISTHKAEVVSVSLEKHPNADNLSVIKVFGYVYVGQTKMWENVTKGIYFPPDSLLDVTRPEFVELFPDAKYNADSTKGGTYARIKAKRLRGIVSYGYMCPAPEEAQLGEDWADKLGVAHYEPPLVNTGGKGGSFVSGEVAKGPAVYAPKYDVDSFQRYAAEAFTNGETVVVTEKIHGANGRWVFHNGEFHCGSRTEWKKEFSTPPDVNEVEAQMRAKSKLTGEALEAAVAAMKAKITTKVQPQNMWWKALRQYPEMMAWLQEHPDIVVYGEVYGEVQNMKYGAQPGELRIAVFDILNNGTWMDSEAARLAAPELPWVPLLSKDYSFDFDKLVELAEGLSLIPNANHFREGIVVSPLHERTHSTVGRVKLKIVSSSYLEMKG